MVKQMDRQPTVSGPDWLKQLTVLEAIYWIHKSWMEVEQSTITVYLPYNNSVSGVNIEKKNLLRKTKVMMNMMMFPWLF